MVLITGTPKKCYPKTTALRVRTKKWESKFIKSGQGRGAPKEELVPNTLNNSKKTWDKKDTKCIRIPVWFLHEL